MIKSNFSLEFNVFNLKLEFIFIDNGEITIHCFIEKSVYMKLTNSN